MTKRIEPYAATISSEVFDQLDAHGYVCCALGDGVEQGDLAQRLNPLGTTLDVYGDGHVWSDLQVKIEAAPNRTHGVGCNPLHLDYVNRSQPPQWIVLTCARADPLHGGATMIADLRRAAMSLTPAHQNLLSKPWFCYWNDADARHVGDPLDFFSVLPTQDDFTRFTAKMIPHLDGTQTCLHADAMRCWQDVLAAMQAYAALLDECTLVRRLLPGDVLIFDQKRWAHGRQSLGEGQSSLEQSERRLLWQAYFGEVEDVDI